jgi:hypothetical protein
LKLAGTVEPQFLQTTVVLASTTGGGSLTGRAGSFEGGGGVAGTNTSLEAAAPPNCAAPDEGVGLPNCRPSTGGSIGFG